MFSPRNVSYHLTQGAPQLLFLMNRRQTLATSPATSVTLTVTSELTCRLPVETWNGSGVIEFLTKWPSMSISARGKEPETLILAVHVGMQPGKGLPQQLFTKRIAIASGAGTSMRPYMPLALLP